jgi:hypothetical protein
MSAQIANLVYDAKAERLKGNIGTAPSFDVPGFSGGSRGHKKINSKITDKIAKLYLYSEATSFSSRFANTPTIGEGTAKKPYKQRGGTLPPGHYSCTYLKNHKTFGECIYLKRNADTHLRYPTASGISTDNRDDDFYIHGSGPKGSDGCIVITDEKERNRLNKAVHEFSQHGHVVLLVKNVAYLLPAERGDIALV